MQSKIGQAHVLSGSTHDDRGYSAVTVWIKAEHQGLYEIVERASKADIEGIAPSRKVRLTIGPGPYHALLRTDGPVNRDPLKRAIGHARPNGTVSLFVPHFGYFEELNVPLEWIAQFDHVREERIDYRKWGRVSQEVKKAD